MLYICRVIAAGDDASSLAAVKLVGPGGVRWAAGGRAFNTHLTSRSQEALGTPFRYNREDPIPFVVAHTQRTSFMNIITPGNATVTTEAVRARARRIIQPEAVCTVRPIARGRYYLYVQRCYSRAWHLLCAGVGVTKQVSVTDGGYKVIHVYTLSLKAMTGNATFRDGTVVDMTGRSLDGLRAVCTYYALLEWE
jgi:hypothetical protein